MHHIVTQLFVETQEAIANLEIERHPSKCVFFSSNPCTSSQSRFSSIPVQIHRYCSQPRRGKKLKKNITTSWQYEFLLQSPYLASWKYAKLQHLNTKKSFKERDWIKYLNMFQGQRDPNWLHDHLRKWFLTARPPEYINKNIITVVLGNEIFPCIE